jgi:ABC-type transport system substrate-binding protein
MSVLHTLGEFNTTGHVDEELDYLIETQSQEFDLVKRREVMLEIQRHVLNNAYRFMPITGKSMWVWWPRVNNFNPNFAGFEYSHWSRIWLDD